MPFQDSDQNGLAWGSQGTVYRLTGNTAIWQRLRVGALAGYTHPSNTAQVPPAASRVSLSLKSLHHHFLPHTHSISQGPFATHTLLPHVSTSVVVTHAGKGEALRESLEEAPNIRQGRNSGS